ncbi:MAG TPA: AMP-binding protein, partial [Acidimicrobiales bacterium]
MSDDLPQTIGAVVTRAAERFGDAEAFVDGAVSLSYVELAAEVERAARAFIASGLEPGDRVAIWGPNCLEWAVAELGLHTAGAVLVPLNTRFKGREAAYVLNKSRARLLFTVTDFLDTDYVALLDGVEGLDTLEETITLRGASPAGTTPMTEFLARSDQVSREAAVERAAGIDGEDLSDILFTSGTTG